MLEQPSLSEFQKKLAERKAIEEAEAAAKQTPKVVPTGDTFDPDLIPEPAYDRSEDDLKIDSIIDGIDILDAYARWCGKMVPKVAPGQVESIMISCPIPAHPDKTPSAWINTDKQTWYCEPCGEGGDKFDLAAIYHGEWNYGPSKPYKDGANFHKLRLEMAEDYGFTVQRLAGGETVISPPREPDPVPEPTPDAPMSDSNPKERTFTGAIASVIDLIDADDPMDIDLPGFDWRPIVPEESFLKFYMEAASEDDVPEEYHFFHALIALGFAIGRDVKLFDQVPVLGNLFVCILGRSGSGKSKAKRHLDHVLQAALPFDPSSSPPKGVKIVSSVASAEMLIASFMKPVVDPSNPKIIAYYDPIKGLVDFNELSQLIGRAQRQGNTLKPTLMEFYDGRPVVSTSSLTTGEKSARDPFASCLTTSQPAALRDLVGRADDASGFLNRWVFVTGREKKRYSVGGVMVDMSPCVGPLEDVHGWAGSFRNGELMTWSDAALKVFDDWFQHVYEPRRKNSDNNLLIRMDLLMKKITLLLSANKHEKVVSEQTVLDALHLYQYFTGSYGVPEAQIGNTMYNEVSDAVVDQMKKIKAKTGKGASIRDITRNLYRRKYDSRIISQAIDNLTKLDLVEIENDVSTGPGRKTKRYHYVG